MSRRAVPGSNERPEGEFEFDTERPPDGPIQPGVYIVTQRPASLSAKLLPPFFLIALGVGFLIYREAAADWRGISALADWFEPAKVASAPTPDPVPAPAVPPAVALNSEPVKPIEPPVLEPPKIEHTPKAEVDPLADIQRESEKEKARIAELEKLKAREEEKLAATEDQRREEQHEDQMQRHGLNPQQLTRIQEMIRQHQQMFDQQVEAMQEMQQRFLGRGFPDARRPQLPRPGLGFGMIPMPPLPQMGQGDGDEVVQRLPDGGETRFRRFNGPNGNGFVWQFRGGNLNRVVPPPPKPGLRDDNDPEPAQPKPVRPALPGLRFD